ncbi:UNVERIFIED_CONTAM: hypothetical protein GTU68_031253 [Idotea baltica]|nr:hypothetical protein [Idotea baltica]
MDSYPVPAQRQEFETEVKRSRFVTSVDCVDSKEAAKSFIQSVRAAYPDANHHCWAMVAGRPDDIYLQDQSDDGEPKGTAGKPMLNVLQHSGLGNVVAVVTRYFGGVCWWGCACHIHPCRIAGSAANRRHLVAIQRQSKSLRTVT